MSVISLAFGDGFIHTYDGSGAETGLKKLNLPTIPVGASVDYGVLYNRAQTFVNTAIGAATKVIVSNSDGLGTLTDDGSSLLEPKDPASFKGLATLSNEYLLALIKLHVQKKINTIDGLLIPQLIDKQKFCTEVFLQKSWNLVLCHLLNSCHALFVTNLLYEIIVEQLVQLIVCIVLLRHCLRFYSLLLITFVSTP